MPSPVKKDDYFLLRALLIYLLSTLLLFNFGPVDWIHADTTRINLFLLITWGFLVVGYYIGVNKSPQPVRNGYHKTIIRYGVILNLLTVFPSIYAYTGKTPLQLVDIFTFSQGDIYRQFQMHLSGSDRSLSGFRLVQVITRALVQPLIFGTVVLGIKYWRTLSLRYRVLVVVNVLAQVTLSMARGTDKEIIDLLILMLTAYYVLHARTKILSLKNVVIAVVCLAMFFTVFVDRRLSRFSDEVPECFGSVGVCLNRDHPLNSVLSNNNFFGASLLSSYMTQGYNGLSIALDLESGFTYGVGHASSVSNLVDNVVGSDIYGQTINYQLRSLGWHDRYVWSSAYTWFANDVTFYGVPFVLLGFGFLLGLAWIDATKMQSDSAIILLCFIVLMLVYTPANFQLGVSIDMYFSWWFWLIFWGVKRLNKNILIGNWAPAHFAATTRE